jgi:hypothetical protein
LSYNQSKRGFFLHFILNKSLIKKTILPVNLLRNMNENEKIITKFYDALAAGNTSKCLNATTVKFRDPIFGSLNANEVSKMWEMLIIRSSGNQNKAFRCKIQ